MSQNKKRLPLWPAIIMIIIILVLFILNPLCRYFYTKDFVARGDKQLAEMLAENMEDAQVTTPEKPIFFIGSNGTRTNGSCLDLSTGKYDIYSVFDVADARSLGTLEASQYIVDYLNDAGYHYTAPTAEDWALCEAEIEANTPLWKAFPWYESILETENCIIVQLTYVDFFS